MYLNMLKIFIPTALSFFIAIFFTPVATHFFYKYKMWKKKPRTENTISLDFQMVHKPKENDEVSVPCVGGTIIWLSVLVTILVFYAVSLLFPNDCRASCVRPGPSSFTITSIPLSHD